MGPDLFGVTTRRETAWLARWLKEPDEMIEEGDPIAMQLLSRYQELRMPNLGLNDVDVRALIEFLETQTPALAQVPSSHRNHSPGRQAGRESP